VKYELIDEEVEKKGDILVSVISEIRREKSKRHTSMKTPVKQLNVYAGQNERKIIEDDLETIKRTCNVSLVNVQPFDDSSPGMPVQEYANIRIKLEL